MAADRDGQNCSAPRAQAIAVVVLVSGRGSNLQAIIDACKGDFPARVAAVLSNRPGAHGLERARQAGIPTRVLEANGFESRADYDRELIRLVDEFAPDLIALAGFMRILGAEFVSHFVGRVINIHPSLLPEFPGLNTHQRALDAGVNQHGASVHFVDEDLDAGPVIIQARVPVNRYDDAQTLAARVLAQEHRIYPQAIRWIAERRLRIEDGRVLLDGEPALVRSA